MNKPICLAMSILESSKTVMYEFWYHYTKPKYGNKANLCYMDINSIIVNTKTEDVYKDNANDLEKKSDTSKCKIKGPIKQVKMKK